MVTQQREGKTPDDATGKDEKDQEDQRNNDAIDGKGLQGFYVKSQNVQFEDEDLEDLSEDERDPQGYDEVRPRMLPDLQAEARNLDNIQRGTGRGAGGARTGSQTRPGRGPSQNPAYHKKVLEGLEENIREGKGIKVHDVAHYSGFFGKIGQQHERHETDLNPVKGGKEGPGILGVFDPDEYIHPKLRGKPDRTYTDSKGRVKDYETTDDGYDITLTDPRLAAEKNMGIWSRAYRIHQEQKRPALKEMLTDMVLEVPTVSAVINGKKVKKEVQMKNRLMGRRTAADKGDKGEEIVTDPTTGESETVEADKVRRAAVQPVVEAMAYVMEQGTHNIITDKTVCALETIQNTVAMLEDKVNLLASRTNLGFENRPTKRELNQIIQSEKQARFNMVLRVGKEKLNQLRGTNSMDKWKTLVVGWFREVNASGVYQSCSQEFLRQVSFNKNPRDEDYVSIILTWDTEDRVGSYLDEYRRIEEEHKKKKIKYQGSGLADMHLKLGRIAPFRSIREKEQDDEFFGMTRNTNDKNAGIFKNAGLGSFEETKKKMEGGEWKNMPSKVYTTRGRNDSKGPTTFLQDYKVFSMNGERREEWTKIVQSQMKYLENGANKGNVKGGNQEIINWLPEPKKPGSQTYG